MDESRRRRNVLVYVVTVVIVFGAMTAVASLLRDAAPAWEFASTGVILALTGLAVLVFRPNPGGPWWNRPVRIRTRRQLLGLAAYLLLSLFVVLVLSAKLIGPGAAAFETAVLVLLVLAALVIGWRRIGTS